MNATATRFPEEARTTSPESPSALPPVIAGESPPARPAGTLDVLLLLAGVLLSAGGLVLGSVIVVAVLGLGARAGAELPAEPRALVLYGVALAALGVLLGLPLVLAGVRALRGQPPRLIALGPWWAWLLPWPLVLAAGQWSADSQWAGLHAALHFTAMSLPPLAVAAGLGARLRARGVTWRTAWAHVVAGAVLATGLAMVLEILGALVLIVAVIVPAGLIDPNVTERVRELFAVIASGRPISPGFLQSYLDWPLVQLLALAILGLLIPLIEELVKPIGVLLRLAAGPRTLGSGRAFLLGGLAGVGFALLEGPLNAASTPGAEGWLLIAVLRAAATLLHAFNTALVAWGWAELIGARRPLRWLGALAGALALHGAWNAITVVVAFTGSDPGRPLAGVVAVLGYGCLTGVALVPLAGLLVGLARLRRAEALDAAAAAVAFTTEA